jgi:eukaryotic-like serine/threonine-protein kinase
MAELPSPELTQSQDQQPTRASDPAATPAPVSDPDSSQLKTWGNFQLLQRLGRGGFGEVFRAWDPVLEREVALKLLLPRGQNPEQEFASLVSEARAMARVRHPNIVSVYGVDRRDGRVGFWSDYIRGQTLSALIAARGPLAAPDAALLGIALCEALAAVHHAGLLHRDIKPGNAMRDADGRVLLMDFGLSHGLLTTAAMAGTPGYLAPELSAGQPASVQSDIYAMGILLRFLITGSSLPDLRSMQNPGTPPQKIAAIIARATQSDPKLRYLSAEQMAAALRELIAAPAPPKPSALAPLRSWRFYIIATAILLVVLLFAPRFFHKSDAGAPAAGTPASTSYLAANDALLRYDKPGNTDKAIALYQSVLKQSPNYALAEAGLARAYWRKFLDTSETKWADDATQAASRAVEMNPNLAPVQRTVGMIHVNQGKFDVGMQELEQAQKLDPRSADVHADLAEAYRQQGRIADAKNEFQTAMDLDNDNWRWPYLLGALQIDTGDLKGAEQNLNAALAKTPDNARILYDLGIVYRKDGRLAEAESALEKSIALDPRADPLMELGQVAVQQNDYAKAISSYERAVQVSPSDYDAWGNLGAVYQISRQHQAESVDAYRKAIALASEAILKNPEDPYLVSVLGEYYANLHDENRALPLMRKAVALAPTSPDVLQRVGESYEVLGHRKEAISFIKKALDLGFSLGYARNDPTLKALRQDPDAPPAIRESQFPAPKHGGKQ